MNIPEKPKMHVEEWNETQFAILIHSEAHSLFDR